MKSKNEDHSVDYRVLQIVDKLNGVTTHEVAQRLNIKKSRADRILNRLRSHGYVFSRRMNVFYSKPWTELIDKGAIVE